VTGFDAICEKCEELLQPYLDRELDDSETPDMLIPRLQQSAGARFL
jgi:hypothetical protein